jgi:hypothetical protein
VTELLVIAAVAGSTGSYTMTAGSASFNGDAYMQGTPIPSGT